MNSSRKTFVLVVAEITLLSLIVKTLGLSPSHAAGIIIAQGIVFGALNGGNDAPNSVATLAATRVFRSMFSALILATVFNFLGTISGEAVAKTIAKGIVPLENLTPHIAIAGVGGAVLCASIATLRGLPISITHSLVGGLLGAGVGAGLIFSGDPYAKIAWDSTIPYILIAIGAAFFMGGAIGYFHSARKNLPAEYYILLWCIVCTGIISSIMLGYLVYAENSLKLSKIILGVTLAPFWSMAIGAIATIAINRIVVPQFFRNKSQLQANTFFRMLQWFTGAGLSYTHGWNDGQNIIAILIFASAAGGYSEGIEITWWMKITAASSIAFGTLILGVPVMQTMAFKVARMTPADGFAAQVSAAFINAVHTLKQIPFIGGIPISTTHAKGGAIMGTAIVKRVRFLNIETAEKMLGAWIITLPLAALSGLTLLFLFHYVLGV